METIKEKEELSDKDKEAHLNELLRKANIDLTKVSNSTESIGHRNVSHRRSQSTSLFSILDAPATMRRRARSSSLAELPDLTKYYPGSHLLDGLAEQEHTGSLYLSLWLLPPLSRRTHLSKEVAQLAMKYAHQGSSSPFMPHITVIGSIRADSHRDVQEIAEKLTQGLQFTGLVPCRFVKDQPCLAMYTNSNKDNNDNNHDKQLVWSQSCIAIMERSEEYMNLLAQSRTILELPTGEWMFPGPACEPHYSKFYGTQPIPMQVEAPPDFVAEEAALYMTTPGTLKGVAKWREVTTITLRSDNNNNNTNSNNNNNNSSTNTRRVGVRAPKAPLLCYCWMNLLQSLLVVFCFLTTTTVVHAYPGMSKTVDLDPTPRVMEAKQLLKLIHEIRQEDFRMVRPQPTEPTIEKQHVYCPSQIPSLLLTLCTSTAEGKSVGKMTVSLHQRGLAAEALSLCMTNQPDFRDQATNTSFFHNLRDIQQKQLAADNLSQGLVLILKDGIKQVWEDPLGGALTAMAQAAEALWISSYHHAEHLQRHWDNHAVEILGEWIMEASTKHATLLGGENSGDGDGDKHTSPKVVGFPFFPAHSVMWSLAALQNMAANYCANELGFCIWHWHSNNDNNEVALDVSEDTPILEAPELAEQVRERIVSHPNLLSTITEWVCRGPIREKPDQELGWPGDATLYTDLTLNHASPHLQAPSIVPWAAAGVIKNLLLSKNTTLVNQVKFSTPYSLQQCLCDMMVYSPDWLEHGKAVDAIHFWAPPDSSVCPDIYANCQDDTLWQNAESGDTCEEYTLDRWCIEFGTDVDEYGKTANEACCLCGGGNKLSSDELMEEVEESSKAEL